MVPEEGDAGNPVIREGGFDGFQEKKQEQEEVLQTDANGELQASIVAVDPTAVVEGEPPLDAVQYESDVPVEPDNAEDVAKVEMADKEEENKLDLEETKMDFGEKEEDGGEDRGEGVEGFEGVDEDDGGDVEDINRSQMPVSERRKKKRLEVFVGGLDKDATEQDIREVFETVGEVVEVRLMKDPKSGRNKGYAFVRYATTSSAARAATELELAQVRGKKVGVLPSEENDTLFVGNINKSWAKEDVMESLNNYGITGLEEVTLMEDPQHEGMNRGFAFVEFREHKDALSAWRKLQTPEAMFGLDRSAKVAWAQPLNEPDEETMSQVKSVFVDGMPPAWTEDQLQLHFGKFGEIERVVLARNMTAAKRKDFGFVNFKARDAAVAAIEAMNNTEITEDGAKVRMRVTLAKPQSKPRPVKGGIRGGFPVRGGRGGFESRDSWAGDAGGRYDSSRVNRGGSRDERSDARDGGKGRREVEDEKSSIDSLLRVLREQAEREEKASTNGAAVKQKTTPTKPVSAATGPSPNSTTAATDTGPAVLVKEETESEPIAQSAPAESEMPVLGADKSTEDSESKLAKPSADKIVNDKYECNMCGFGSDIEEEYERHLLTKVHKLIANLRRDERLANKTPLSILHEFASRNRAEVTYETQSDTNLGPFEITAKIRGGINGVPEVSAIGKGRQKTKAKQTAAAEALEVLMKDVPESEFTKPGQARLKAMDRRGGDKEDSGRGGSRGERGNDRGGDHNRRRDDRRGGRHERDVRGHDRDRKGGYGGNRYGRDERPYGSGSRYQGNSYGQKQETYAERLERIQGRGYAMRLLSQAPPVQPTVVYSMDDRVQVVGVKRPYVIASPGDVGPMYMEPRGYPRARVEAADANQMVVESSRQSYGGAYGGQFLPMPSSAPQGSTPSSGPPGAPNSFPGGPSGPHSGNYAATYGTTYNNPHEFGNQSSSEPFGSAPGGGGSFQSQGPAPFNTAMGSAQQPQAHASGNYGQGGGSSHF